MFVYLEHERLDVYNASLELIVVAHRIVAALPPGQSDLASQLRRAASSVTLNIAEGAGELARAEKARFYRMARRSAMECAAAIDIARHLDIADPDDAQTARQILIRIVSMLTTLVRPRE